MELKHVLKCDFHMHTKDDPQDCKKIKYSAEELIDLASEKGFQVMSITNHNKITYSPYLREYAKHRGILLIPGTEVTVEGRHILLINYLGEIGFRKISDLWKVKRLDTLILAAHPFFPGKTTLKDKLVENIDLFDGIEFCHFYRPWVNFNTRAIQVSKQFQKPLVETSDVHFLPQLNHTYSMVETQTKTAAGIVQAIKKGQLKIVSQPVPVSVLFHVLHKFGWGIFKTLFFG